jgi:hypothetical protein
MDGIFIPTVPNAPFSARVDGLFTETLKDGTVVSRKFYNLIGRDNSGRTHTEQRRWVLADSVRDSELTRITLRDPITRIKTSCYPAKKLCELTTFDPRQIQNELATQGNPGVQSQDLGGREIESLETVGTRETTTHKTSAGDATHSFVSEKEIWFSPRLQTNLVVFRDDPRYGKQKLTMTHITLSEPEASFFQAPEDFRIVDER